MAQNLDVSHLDDDSRLRGAAMGEAASVVSAYQPVRDALLAFQRQFAMQEPGAVLDGRDIGTVVCPDAQVKLFITAAPEERARRRHRELLSRGERPEYETILVDIRRRDERDMNRSTAPLKAAPTPSPSTPRIWTPTAPSAPRSILWRGSALRTSVPVASLP